MKTPPFLMGHTTSIADRVNCAVSDAIPVHFAEHSHLGYTRARSLHARPMTTVCGLMGMGWAVISLKPASVYMAVSSLSV